MNINFSGYKENVLTFECASGVSVGDLVKMTSSGKVTKTSANDDFIGVAVSVSDGYAAVQLDGYVELPKNGSISVGYNSLVAYSSTTVTAAESGIERLVIYVGDNTIGVIL